MLGIVLTFLGTGYHVNKSVEQNIENSYREFEVVTNVLSPLFDTYALGIADSQVKVAHGQISVEEFCAVLVKNTDKQKVLLNEYAKFVSGKESLDDKQLFALVNSVFLYTSKIQDLCKKRDIDAIHAKLYSGELYKVIDPTTTCINRILDEKFLNTEKFKMIAKRDMTIHRRILTLASSLAMILGVMVLVSKKMERCRKRSFKAKNKSVKFKDK